MRIGRFCIFLAMIGLLSILVACSSVGLIPPAAAPTPALAAVTVPLSPTPGVSASTTPEPGAIDAAARWQEILAWTPYPHTTPLPPRAHTPVDGVYVYIDAVHPAGYAHCRRCPPYPPLAGPWKLYFDEGIFRVMHPDTGWRTLGSYAVADNRITFFNDPQCHRAVGVFQWQMQEDALIMQLVHDDCELGTRAILFTGGPWRSCQPPNREAAISGHWNAPEGCE